MGKSPGKWIKTVLFGKKSSKSNLSKAARIEKKAAAEPPSGNFDASPPVISDASYQSIDRFGDKGDPEKVVLGDVQGEVAASFPVKPGADLLDATGFNPTDNAERQKQQQAATKAQAAFRGYLARRAFRALKGIIRLQALIRGHLVRRQAVATLRCMRSIVKFQALARGRRVRLSNTEVQWLKKCRLHEIPGSTQVGLLGIDRASRSEKLATNAFANKFLASLPTAMPLSLLYGLDEPNAAWNWLERWSLLRFWEPLARPKKILDAKSQGKQGRRQTIEAEPGKSRRTFRKVATAANGDNNTLSSLEVEKPRRNPRKAINHQVESLQEQPPNELERVKRNLRKVSTTPVVSEKLEAETEKPQQNVKKAPNVPASDISEPVIANISEKPSDLAVTFDKVDETEVSSEPLMVDEPVDLPHASCPAVEQNSIENDIKVEMNATVNEEPNMKEDQSGKENQKTRRRRSFLTKQEYPENVSQNTPSLPSYMEATESAKAKLRAQGSVKLSEEDAVENGFVRRHSLPSSTNGKLSSVSPRVQKLAQANGKGGSKSNKSLSASRDERVLQPGWRR